jgi:cytochrome c peroxidase
MKHLPFAPTLLALALLTATVCYGEEAPSIELGQALFHSPALGSNGKSCSTCHAAGRGLAEIDAYTDAQLRDLVNACIRDALAGRMLSDGSQELDSLVLYLRSLTK